MPGVHVWRDATYSSQTVFPFDTMYSVCSDHYGTLEEDLVVRQKVSLTSSLWQNEYRDDEDESDSEADWMSLTAT